MVGTSSPAPASVVETCWSTIEAYADLEASVSVSQTCRALHQAIVDADSNKLKVSHFEVDNSPFPSSPDQIVAKNWHSAPARIPHYLSRSLNSIHFPSLRRIYLDFPATKRLITSGHADVIDDACTSSFPMFAAYLSYAKNLETLHFDANRLLATERSGQLEASIEIFAQNLCNCGKLRDLSVVNSGVVRGSLSPVYSVALMRAMTHTMKQRNGLERLRLTIAETPSDPLYDRLLSSRRVDVVFDFLVAAFSTESLSALELILFGSLQHLNALINAAKFLLSDGTTANPSCIKTLKLSFQESVATRSQRTFFQIRSGAAPLLELFSECRSLERLFLDLPADCWEEESTQAMRKLLENKQKLSFITISFSSFRSGEMMRALFECLTPNIASGSLHKLCCYGMMDIDPTVIIQLQGSLVGSGMMCTDFRATRNRHGNLDVMVMDNRKRFDGEVTIDGFTRFLSAEKREAILIAQMLKRQYGSERCRQCQGACIIYQVKKLGTHYGKWVVQCERGYEYVYGHNRFVPGSHNFRFVPVGSNFKCPDSSV